MSKTTKRKHIRNIITKTKTITKNQHRKTKKQHTKQKENKKHKNKSRHGKPTTNTYKETYENPPNKKQMKLIIKMIKQRKTQY